MNPYARLLALTALALMVSGANDLRASGLVSAMLGPSRKVERTWKLQLNEGLGTGRMTAEDFDDSNNSFNWILERKGDSATIRTGTNVTFKFENLPKTVKTLTFLLTNSVAHPELHVEVEATLGDANSALNPTYRAEVKSFKVVAVHTDWKDSLYKKLAVPRKNLAALFDEEALKTGDLVLKGADPSVLTPELAKP
jgi:hypothetical protein